MENQTLNGEAPVLEESVEAPVDHTVVDDPVVVEEPARDPVEDLAGSAGGEAVEDVGNTENGEALSGASGGDGQTGAESGELGSENSDISQDDVSVGSVSDVNEDHGQGSEYDLNNPMPVVIVEPEEEEAQLEVFSLSGSYPGTISDTYLNFFRGIVQKLRPYEHYVLYRSGQYSYTMVYGEEVSEDAGQFTGTGNVVTVYRDSSSYSSDWYVDYGTDTLALDSGSLFVYSDLGMFPSLKEGGSALEFSTLLFAVGFAVVYSVCHDIFDYVMEHVYRK